LFLLVRAEVDIAARLDLSAARLEIARLVLETAGRVQIGEVVTLQSDKLPFKLQLYAATRRTDPTMTAAGLICLSVHFTAWGRIFCLWASIQLPRPQAQSIFA